MIQNIVTIENTALFIIIHKKIMNSNQCFKMSHGLKRVVWQLVTVLVLEVMEQGYVVM